VAFVAFGAADLAPFEAESIRMRRAAARASGIAPV
jgi:hypothetical protein